MKKGCWIALVVVAALGVLSLGGCVLIMFFGLEEMKSGPGREPVAATAPAGAGATKNNPFVNTLGMRFVPVTITGGRPTEGKRVLFSIWETRVKDYAAYAADNADVAWKDSEYNGHKQGGDHPVVNVSWEDARRFCQWLSIKESANYRLPTDHEWSCAVGIGDRESATESPEEKNRKIADVYPWGNRWPPPDGAGNLRGQESAFSRKIAGYRDQHPFTAPVGSYSANEFGLCDLIGNAWEWCDDWYDGRETSRVLRGGSWHLDGRGSLLSSCRGFYATARRTYIVGFRVVLSGESER